MKKVNRKKKAEAVKDYLSSGQSLAVVSVLHDMSVETLRKAIGPNRMRKRGRKRVSSGVQGSLFPSIASRVRVRKGKNSGVENNNKRWGSTDNSLLIDSLNDGLTVSEAAKLLGRTNASVSTRKYFLIKSGLIKDPVRFPVPDGIKRPRKASDVEEVEESKVAVVENVNVQPMPSGGCYLDRIDLVDLADLVKRFGLDVTITISGDVTTVNMHS